MSAKLASLLVVLVIAAPAAAQYGFGYPGYYHSSTYGEGVQRGYADVVRSHGMANLLNSEAAKNYEDARKSYIDNRLRATQTYFEMRRYNEEARRAARPSPLSNEEYVRLARQAAPAQLTTTQLDPLTGAIGWPVALRKNEYAPLRERLERLFHDRAGGLTVYGEINKAVEELQAALTEDLAEFAANDYLAAKNFLTSLAYVGRSPV
jgi:hypothetical protein